MRSFMTKIVLLIKGFFFGVFQTQTAGDTGEAVKYKSIFILTKSQMRKLLEILTDKDREEQRIEAYNLLVRCNFFIREEEMSQVFIFKGKENE